MKLITPGPSFSDDGPVILSASHYGIPPSCMPLYKGYMLPAQLLCSVQLHKTQSKRDIIETLLQFASNPTK